MPDKATEKHKKEMALGRSRKRIRTKAGIDKKEGK